MNPTYGMSLSGVTHATAYGLCVHDAGSGAIELATDATAEQPFGIVDGGDQYDVSFANIVVFGAARALVGAAGLTAGFHWVTCDDASKIKAANAGDARLGYTFVTTAKTANQPITVFVCPSYGEPSG